MISFSLETELLKSNDLVRFYPSDPKAYIRRGTVNFKLGRIDESIADFDRAEALDSDVTPYLWQRGLSYYYAERFAEGAKQFEIDLTVNPQDVEETIWRYLCIAREKGLAKAKNSLLEIKKDPRAVMRKVYDFYAGKCKVEDLLATGKRDGKRGNFYSHLYLGLYYEVEEEPEKAREYILKAVSDYQIDDYMWYLAVVHQKLRNW